MALQCRLSGNEEWPQVVPVACIIGNETNRNEFIGLSNGCYENFGSTVYYCSITGKVDVNRLENNRLNGTWRYNWQLSWNTTSDDVSLHLINCDQPMIIVITCNTINFFISDHQAFGGTRFRSLPS